MSKSVQESGSRCLHSLLDYSNERARMGRGRKSFYPIGQLFPLKHRHKENKAIQRSLEISFRELLTKLQYYGSIN